MSNNKSYEVKRIIKYQTRLDNSKRDISIHLVGAALFGTAAAFNLNENFATTIIDFLTQTQNDVIQNNLGREMMGRWMAILGGYHFFSALIDYGRKVELMAISKEIENAETFQTVDKPKQYVK